MKINALPKCKGRNKNTARNAAAPTPSIFQENERSGVKYAKPNSTISRRTHAPRSRINGSMPR